MKKTSIAGALIVALVGCGESVPSAPVYQDNARITTGTQTSEPFVERKVPSDAELNGCRKYWVGVAGDWSEVKLCPAEPEPAAASDRVSKDSIVGSDYGVKSPYWPGPAPFGQ